MPSGTVKWFSERRHYGFIIADTGEEVFLHGSEISSEDMPICEGDRVIFTRYETPQGMQAKEVFKLVSYPQLGCHSGT